MVLKLIMRILSMASSPVEEINLINSKSISRVNYSAIGCDKCGAKHKYGLDREFLICYRCGRQFSPLFDGRKYESDKIK